MENLRKVFKEKGYSITVHPEDEKSFYCCLYSATHNAQHPVSTQHASQMQTDIFEFEMKNAIYFHLFQSQCIECNGNHTASCCLKRDFESVSKEKKTISPRECYAAADFLQRCICLVRYNQSTKGDLKGLKGYIFAPVDTSCVMMESICILMLEEPPGSVHFANVYCNDNLTTNLSMFPGVIVNKEHKHCYGLRFANEFSLLFDGNVSYGRKPDVKDLYRRLSLEFYGTEEHHERILNTICNFQLEADNLDLFCKYADNSDNEETSFDDKKRILNSHVENVRNGSKLSGTGEFYALSSVYNVDIIIDGTGRGEWETYMSVVCTYASCFESPIILRRQNSEGEGCYFPNVTQPDSCSCCQNIPAIQGHIGKIKANIHEAVLKYPCCPQTGRRYNHTHLKDLPNIRTHWPLLIDYIKPSKSIEMISMQLEVENRRLDQIKGGNGSLAEAIAKELYGDENQFVSREILGEEHSDLDEKLLRLSNWLKVPVYVYCDVEEVTLMNGSVRCFWTKYEPKNSLPSSKVDCRFYVTLFHNRTHNSFDRITPLRGCNCQIPPPLSLLQNSQMMQSQYLECVIPGKRHHPLVSFLSEELNENVFEIEIRDFPVCSPFSAVKIAKKRNDMKERTIDCVKMSRHSLLRCLSKEIFGTENHVDILINEFSKELQQNICHYTPFIGKDITSAYKTTVGEIEENKTCHEKLACFIKERIEDDLSCSDLLLWLACTFLQTRIYVLRITDTNTTTESFWTEYAKVRVRRKDPNTRKSFARKCPKNSRYYISLLETGKTEYHRIVPKLGACNCCLQAPTVPNHQNDSTHYYTQQDRRLTREIRRIDNQLNAACILIDKWLFYNKMLQQKCDTLILEIEGRRKNVNIATITGSSAGIVGTVMTGVGFMLAPATGGVSTLLSVGGAVLAASGGTLATGAKLTESVLNRETISTLKRYQNCYQESLESLKSVMDQLAEELNKLSKLSNDIRCNHSLESSDFANIQSIPGVVRAVKGLVMIPLGVLKVSSRGIVILGAIIGPLTALVDALLLVFSAVNMTKGNKTDVTENLRRISASLYGSRRQMHNWAYGNQGHL